MPQNPSDKTARAARGCGARKPVPHRDTISPHWRCEKIRYRYWKPGIAQTPAAKLSRSGGQSRQLHPRRSSAASGSAPTSRTWQRRTRRLRDWASPEGLTNGDHGVTGSNKDRPGLNEAPAAVRAGDTLVLTELDRFARSPPDAQDIIEDTTTVSQELWLQTGMTMKI
jgi:hypothetical protein